jgi:hypothetical protein
MTKKPIGRPKKEEKERKVTLRIAVKKRHEKEVQTIIDNIAKAYQ